MILEKPECLSEAFSGPIHKDFKAFCRDLHFSLSSLQSNGFWALGANSFSTASTAEASSSTSIISLSQILEAYQAFSVKPLNSPPLQKVYLGVPLKRSRSLRQETCPPSKHQRLKSPLGMNRSYQMQMNNDHQSIFASESSLSTSTLGDSCISNEQQIIQSIHWLFNHLEQQHQQIHSKRPFSTLDLDAFMHKLIDLSLIPSGHLQNASISREFISLLQVVACRFPEYSGLERIWIPKCFQYWIPSLQQQINNSFACMPRSLTGLMEWFGRFLGAFYGLFGLLEFIHSAFNPLPMAFEQPLELIYQLLFEVCLCLVETLKDVFPRYRQSPHFALLASFVRSLISTLMRQLNK